MPTEVDLAGTGGHARAVLGATRAESGIDDDRKPLVADDLEGIVVSGTFDFLGGTERFETTLLMRDGRARLALEGSPLDLCLPADDAAPDGLWTRWRQTAGGDGNGGHEVLDIVNDVWKALGGRLFSPTPEATPAELSGGHVRMRTTVLGATTSTVTERLELALDGSFSRARSVLSTTTRPGFGAGVPSIVHVPESATDPARLGGTWMLLEDGFTLELVDADGRRERSLLLDDGGSRLIGGRRFSYSAETIETIDLFALATRWAAGRQKADDWRSAYAEAMSRNVEQRTTRPNGAPRVPAPNEDAALSRTRSTST